jgi:hypothetical protein
MSSALTEWVKCLFSSNARIERDGRQAHARLVQTDRNLELLDQKIQESKQDEGRHAFLMEQRNNLIEARNQLGSMLDKLEKETGPSH